MSGKIIAGPHVRNAARRHLDDLKLGPSRGLYWDLTAAMRAIQFFPDVLRLAGGQFEGVPFNLHPSQVFRIGSLFGWKKADGTRRFRRFYDEEGKGNGKSPMLAGIGMYCLLADDEPRAEVYAAGSKKDQAMVLFRDAVAMRQQSPALKSRLTPSGGNPVWNLADLRTGSFFRPISSDDGQSGPRPSCALCDEVHEHRNGTTIEMLERGFKFRQQPLLCMATNSGTDRESVCWKERTHAIQVAAGTKTPDDKFTYVGEAIHDATFAFVCSLDPGDDPLNDPSCWIKANPLLGTILTEEYLAGVVADAKQIPGKLNGILRLHFCVWTESDVVWMSREAFDACVAEFDPSEHADKAIYGGLDLSGSQDLTCAAFVAETGRVDRERDGQPITLPTYDCWIEAWTPEDTLQARAMRDQAPYDLWVKDGFLNAIPGKNIRLDYVAARIAGIAAENMIEVIAYDRYSYRKFEQECDDIGLTLNFVEHPQGGRRRAAITPEAAEAARSAGEEPPLGLWMPGSIMALEELILDRRIRFRRNPVLTFAAMSAVTEHDPFDNRWFSKRKAVNRIDAIVAVAMAVGAATAGAPPKSQSFWDTDPPQTPAAA